MHIPGFGIRLKACLREMENKFYYNRSSRNMDLKKRTEKH
jgi:hypothetical protein